MKLSRSLSLAVALGYTVIGFHVNGIEGAMVFALVLLPPLACIWFSDDMGRYMGSNFGDPAINRTTPGCVVAFGGWLLLVVIGVLGATIALRGG